MFPVDATVVTCKKEEESGAGLSNQEDDIHLLWLISNKIV